MGDACNNCPDDQNYDQADWDEDGLGDDWQAKPAVDAADLVSVDAAGWTPKANLLYWSGLSTEQPASYYNCAVMYWQVLKPDGAAVSQSWIKDAYGLDRLLQPGIQAALASSGLDAIDGPVNTPAADLFTTADTIGGLTARPLPTGSIQVATLTLHLAPQPGVYHLTLIDGQYLDLSDPLIGQAAMDTGPSLEIRVGTE